MEYRQIRPSLLLALGCAAILGVAGPGGAATPAACFFVASGTVRDGRTKLVWQQALPTTGGNGSGKFDWDQAKAYCATLPLAGGGWRLPTHNELMSILDYSRVGPSIDPVAFPQTPNEDFWSASPFTGQAGSAWDVNFGAGYTTPNDKTTPLRVRCVR